MSTEASVRLGIIGLGNIAQQHIAHVQSGQVPDCVLTATCSRSAQATASPEQNIAHFTDYRELIDSGLCDAVLVATPTFTHLEIGCYALDAGMHLMMEKPIGLSVSEGEALLAKQREDQVFGLMLNQRTDPLFQRMRDIVAAGTLGPIVRTAWTMTNWFRPEAYFQVSDWRATWRGEGGGLLLNQCIHNLDIFQWICGMPNAVQAQCYFGKYHEIEVEDEASAILRYDNGASGMFVGSTGEAPGVNRFDVIGDAGSLSFDGERLWLTTNEPATSRYSRETRELFGMPASEVQDITPTRDVNQHALVLQNFVAAIQRRAPLLAPAIDGLNSLSLANAMLLSTWQARTVELPLDGALYQQALQEKLATSVLRIKADLAVNVDMGASYR